MLVKESTKWIIWDCPMMWKAKCFMHHSSQMTQFWARCVHNHAFELRKVLSLKRGVQIDVHSASMLASTSA
jgi:hypothetical protein